MAPQLYTYLPVAPNLLLDRDEIIQEYFHLGFSYLEILGFLSVHHSINMGLRQLHRILRKMGLRRHIKEDNLREVISSVKTELSGCGYTLGYRAMHARLRLQHGICTDRETIRHLLLILDPHGVEQRRKRSLKRRCYWTKGPNYIYHMDGWDKLKRYGLCVHGCIDGFSRRIMWLRAGISNKDPFIVCKYFTDCVKELNGLPCVMRSDRGTENVNIQILQTLLRQDDDDDRARLGTTFMYGTSSSNQRIESWWSKLPSMGMQAWRDHFSQLDMHGILDMSQKIHIECVQFCYMDLLQEHLNLIMTEWNTHHIRTCKFSLSPSGKPDVMFYLPEIYGASSYLRPVSNYHLELLTEVATRDVEGHASVYKEIFDSIFAENNLEKPRNLIEAAEICVLLLDTVEEEIAHL